MTPRPKLTLATTSASQSSPYSFGVSPRSNGERLRTSRCASAGSTSRSPWRRTGTRPVAARRRTSARRRSQPVQLEGDGLSGSHRRLPTPAGIQGRPARSLSSSRAEPNLDPSAAWDAQCPASPRATCRLPSSRAAVIARVRPCSNQMASYRSSAGKIKLQRGHAIGCCIAGIAFRLRLWLRASASVCESSTINEATCRCGCWLKLSNR